MPYHTVEDLPDSVRHHLPAKAQELYLKAFNSAWHTHGQQSDADAVCARIAWSVVKKEFEKSPSGEWVKIS